MACMVPLQCPHLPLLSEAASSAVAVARARRSRLLCCRGLAAAGAPPTAGVAKGARAGRPARADAARGGPAAAPRRPWPFLRDQALAAGLGRCFAPGPGAKPARLWITGSRGSGAGTAVQAAAARAVAAQRGADGGYSISGVRTAAATIIFDCQSCQSPVGTAGAGKTGSTVQADASSLWLAHSFMDALVRQLAESFNSSAALQEQLVERLASVIAHSHEDAKSGLVAAIDAVGNRAGLAGALPVGTEMPGCREALAMYSSDPGMLVVHAANSIVAAVRRLRQAQLQPPTTVHAALLLLRDAGSRGGGGPLTSVKYLLSAAGSLAAVSGCDVLIVLLRAELLTDTPKFQSVGLALLEAIEMCVGDSADSSHRVDNGSMETGAMVPCGTVRMLVQSRSGVDAARAEASGVDVLTADAWSEEMARAVFMPRYLQVEDEVTWRAIWAVIGGHAAHLRSLAEALEEQRFEMEQARVGEEAAKLRAEALLQFRPERSPDSEMKQKQAELEHQEDSVRADARAPPSAPEALLRRLPEVFADDISVFEQQVAAFVGHPLLSAIREAHTDRPGLLVAELCGPILGLCARPAVTVPAPRDCGGLGFLADPFLLALLDAGLLVPMWCDGGAQVVVANELTRSLLLAWVDALCEGLSWWAWIECRFRLWRTGLGAVKDTTRGLASGQYDAATEGRFNASSTTLAATPTTAATAI